MILHIMCTNTALVVTATSGSWPYSQGFHITHDTQDSVRIRWTMICSSQEICTWQDTLDLTETFMSLVGLETKISAWDRTQTHGIHRAVPGTDCCSNKYTENSSKSLHYTIRKQYFCVARFNKFDRKVIAYLSHFKCLTGQHWPRAAGWWGLD